MGSTTRKRGGSASPAEAGDVGADLSYSQYLQGLTRNNDNNDDDDDDTGYGAPGTTNTATSASAGVQESHFRSLAKGFTWRIVATMTTVVIAKIVTGETSTAFQIGFFEFFAKIGIYYTHERIWAKIRL